MDFSAKKAVLFDLDGTLIDTLADITASVNHTMECLGYPQCTLEQVRSYIGNPAPMLLRSAMPQGASDDDVQKALSIHIPFYEAHSMEQTACFPGAQEFCRYLHERGVKIGLITNKVQPTSEVMMSHYFGGIPFDLIWGNDGKRKTKPDPESGALACVTLGVKPSDVLFVGDGDTDMAFAAKCGFTACGVSWGYRSPDVLRKYGADLIVDSFAELQAMF